VLLPAQIQRLDPRRSRQRALELLELVGLQGFERKYPFGLCRKSPKTGKLRLASRH